MIFDDYETVSEDTVTVSQSFIWEVDDRYALIAYLLMSIDKKPDAADLKKLDAFMGINNEEITKKKELCALRDKIVSECNAFLDNHHHNDTYCDCVWDEISHIIQGINDDDSHIGNGYSIGLLTAKPIELSGGAHFIFDYLNMVIKDGNCSENQKRLLKLLATKWNIDKSTLLVLENCAVSLEKIAKQRVEIENGEMSHRDAVSALSNLDMKEKEVWKKLGEFEITNKRAIEVENFKIGLSFASAFIPALKKKPKNDDNSICEQKSKKEKIIDEIGDHIIEGICKIGEAISAPFEWLSGVR